MHTSGGFQAAKNRLIWALIEAPVVRFLAMETPRNMARPLEEYLRRRLRPAD